MTIRDIVVGLLGLLIASALFVGTVAFVLRFYGVGR